MTWIKCSERMPELYSHVLTLYESGSQDVLMFSGDHWFDCWSPLGEGFDGIGITHWQPLPAPPDDSA